MKKYGMLFLGLIAGIFLSVIGISIGELPRLTFKINGVLSLAYLIVFGSFVGYASYIYALFAAE